MAASNVDLVIEQGATFRLSFAWADADSLPIDLTGWDARMQIRKTQGSPALLSASVATGEFTIDGPAGKVSLKLTDEQTDTLTAKSALYDIEVEDTAGDVYRLLEGKVTVKPNITQLPGTPVVG